MRIRMRLWLNFATLKAFEPLQPYLAETETYRRRAKATKAPTSRTGPAPKPSAGARNYLRFRRRLPTVAVYADTEAASCLNTVERHLTAVSQAYQFAGFANPRRKQGSHERPSRESR